LAFFFVKTLWFQPFPASQQPFCSGYLRGSKGKYSVAIRKIFFIFFQDFFSRFCFSILYSLALLFKADANVHHLLSNFLIFEELFLSFFSSRYSDCHYSSALFSFRLAF
jgi:hypothetical protein